MILFYHNLTDCFITDTESPVVAKTVATLFSSRSGIFCCEAGTASNSQLIGKNTVWHEWSYEGGSKFHFYDPLRDLVPSARGAGSLDPFNDVDHVDKFVPSTLDGKTLVLAKKIKHTLECLKYWASFLYFITQSSGSQYIEANYDTGFDGKNEKKTDAFIRECKNILYLEFDVSNINRKIIQLLNKNKDILSCFLQYDDKFSQFKEYGKRNNF
jgi:hypothetical protein